MALTDSQKSKIAQRQAWRKIRLEKEWAPKMQEELERVAVEAGKAFEESGVQGQSIAIKAHRDRTQELLLELYEMTGRMFVGDIDLMFGKGTILKWETKVEDTSLNILFNVWQQTSFAMAQEISLTTNEHLREIVAKATVEAAAEGASEVSMGKIIAEKLGIEAPWRSRMIARTETLAAASETQHTVIKDLDLKTMKEWIPVTDKRTRDSHEDMRGHPPIPEDERFTVRKKRGSDRMLYPGDRRGGSKENVINCRCAVIYEPADPFE